MIFNGMPLIVCRIEHTPRPYIYIPYSIQMKANYYHLEEMFTIKGYFGTEKYNMISPSLFSSFSLRNIIHSVSAVGKRV